MRRGKYPKYYRQTLNYFNDLITLNAMIFIKEKINLTISVGIDI